MSANVRPARAADLEAIAAIYAHYVLHSPATFEEEPPTLEAWSEAYERASGGRPHRLLVAEEAGEVLGFAKTAPFNERAAYRTSVSVSVYCAPGATGRGLGAALYGALVPALAPAGFHRAYAGITQPNEASVALHRRFGFRLVGTLGEAGRKFGRYWDVSWFERALP